ncbi:SAM dependent carboxyl methyltransferase [Dillenia turbinata]|uniref:SAM dependent carboxyl methyltransferase n=1 Tax=Dillenia turbinata TaxID=194707 RepID=A0AAN8UYM9_9MAGN
MDVVHVLHMNEGVGETSYANNSLLQKKVIILTKPITVSAMTDLYSTLSPTKICIADLGCSSGPNTLFVVSELIKTVVRLHKRLGQQNESPEFLVLLNDLPGNDFNTIFKSLLPNFQENLRQELGHGFGPCFVTAAPGSFYGRLFPSQTLHFVHSSYSLQWLSQVPEGLEENKGSIYIASTSPPSVLKAYFNQFQKDFSCFLKCRGEELVTGGRMVLTILGRKSDDPSSKEGCYIWELMALALNDMVAEVPEGLEENKGSIYIASTSPPSVLKAYFNQFQKDFSCFLKCRGEELVTGGRMVLTILGRKSDDPSSKEGCYIWELMALALNDMVAEGLIEEEKLNSFNIPQYTPSPAEIKSEVERNGSFIINKLEVSKVNWDAYENEISYSSKVTKNGGYNVAKLMRAVAEPLLASNFGKSIIDEVFRRYREIVADRMAKERTEFFNVVVSMTKRA